MVGKAALDTDVVMARGYLRESVAEAQAAHNIGGEVLSLQVLAKADAQAGDAREAAAHLARAEELAARADSPAHLTSVKSFAFDVWISLGDRKHALETAYWLVEHAPESSRPGDVPWSYFQLAQALRLGDPGSTAALDLATFARQVLAKHGERGEVQREQVDRWLAGRDPADLCADRDEPPHGTGSAAGTSAPP
jgi:hypothetical protein